MAKSHPSSSLRPASSAGQWVYVFGTGRTDGGAEMNELLGGKGANLAEMAKLGLPVPPGFTITTEACRSYTSDLSLSDGLKDEVMSALSEVGTTTGAKFGDKTNPLLISVRSGSRASMPGMMDTILNLGLNDETVAGLAAKADCPRFAYDSYRRFIQMYADVVLGIDHGVFEEALENYKNFGGHYSDTDLTADDWQKIIDLYKHAIVDQLGHPFPQDTVEQLWGAIGAVFRSWNNPRAVTYRRLHGIPDDWGTAVNVQAMVFGNLSDTSATGVAFTRNPSTGDKEVYGEFLVNAQGEDVVAGIRTPQPLTRAARIAAEDEDPSLEELMPETYAELGRVFSTLEQHYRDMQDVEFTIEDGRLWLLQTRAGKRTAQAALKIAVDLTEEGLISKEDAVLRVEPEALSQLLHPTIDSGVTADILTSGLPASPGAASGEIVFTSDDAEALKSQGRSVILVRVETSPEDIHGMHASTGILTARGGMTSHAAVVARGMGVPCVTGAGSLRIDVNAGTLRVGRTTLERGDIITIDGATGQVYRGQIAMRQPELSGSFGQLIGWADAHRKLSVRANADTPKDARQARTFGAEGIGLCRTEHMFFHADRIVAMREMICATDEKGRRAALAKILPIQRADFVELFEIMAGLPVTIRLLDPPLHEFLPRAEQELERVAEALGIPVERVRVRVQELSEANPMLGFRGVRLGVRYPEITETQVRAIFEAALDAEDKCGQKTLVEVMIPLVAFRREYDLVASIIRRTAEAVEQVRGRTLHYEIGTMVELPRAALRAGEIAEGDDGAMFFSFGTNDLTQTALGLSRDDAAPILGDYMGQGIVETDPFASIDVAGVGELVKIGVQRARAEKPEMAIGVCGEHGGDAQSVEFFHDAGLDYVSCSPFRVPIARLAAAQAAIRAAQRKLTKS